MPHQNNPSEIEDVRTGGRATRKEPPKIKRAPPPLPPPIRPDEQLYWVDLTADRKWDLRLSRPFDRAIGGEVMKPMKPMKQMRPSSLQ